MADKNLAEGAKGLDLISISFLEELAKIRELLGEPAEKDEDEEADEGYAESYGDISEEMKRYHEKLKAYEKIIKENVEAYAPRPETAKEEAAKETELASPFERGHRLGCGCPGCAAYRDFYGIRLETKDDVIIPAAKTAAKKAQDYEEASRPCGGKMYNHFHGEQAGLRNIMGSHTGRFSFRGAGY